KAALKAVESSQKAAGTGTAAGDRIAAPANSTPTTSTAPAPPPGTTIIPDRAQATGESTFSIYGFAMLDAGYQFKQADPNWFDTVRPVKLPAFGNQFAPSGNFYQSVRQSRFGAKSTTPTKYGELKTIFEFELFGTGV